MNDILKAIEQLNEVFIMNKYTEPDFFGFNYETDGYNEAVFFMDIRIWYGCDDTRYFDDDQNEYESYFDCFKRQALKIIDNLITVRVSLEGTTEK